nr:reverse transcriptase domain-containing protein [Tanacetum cinerariifolium]
MARMDAMTIKIDDQYREFQSRPKQPNLVHNDDDKPMSLEEEAKFMQTFHHDDTCFSIDVINEILEEDFDALLDEGSKIFYFIEETILEEKLFAKFNDLMAMTAEENSEFDSDTEEPPLEKITFNTDYKIKTSLKEPPLDLELKPLHDNLEYVFLK